MHILAITHRRANWCTIATDECPIRKETKMKRIAFLALILLLATCAPATPTSTPAPAAPPELSVAEYPLTQPPEAESTVLNFASSVQGDPRTLHAAERAEHFPDTSCTVEGTFGFCVALGSDQLFASENWTDPGAGYVTVARNGQQVYKVDVGPASPVTALRGLWAYDSHWAVETALVNTEQSGNVVTSFATGLVAVDGTSLNDQLGYEEIFGLQTLHGKPFYFFKREGKIDANYAGVDVPLGFDEVPHYNCCSASTLNPTIYPNLVTYFGRRGDTWYYAEIGVFD
jgi:hypothetical protein